jgi:hypothetical protein
VTSSDWGLLGVPHWVAVMLVNQEALMATVAELNAKVDLVLTNLAEARARIAEDFQFLRDQIAALQAGTIQPAELDGPMARLDEAIATLGAIDPEPANP